MGGTGRISGRTRNDKTPVLPKRFKIFYLYIYIYIYIYIYLYQHTLSHDCLASIHCHTTAWPAYIVTRQPDQYLKVWSNEIRAFSQNTSRPISANNGILVSISTVLVLLSIHALHRVVHLQSNLDTTVIAIPFTTATTPPQILQHLNSISDCIVWVELEIRR